MLIYFQQIDKVVSAIFFIMHPICFIKLHVDSFNTELWALDKNDVTNIRGKK